MKDFNITIGNIIANTDMIEEDVLRMEMGLEPKEQKVKSYEKESINMVKNMSKTELNLYCNLLSVAYELYKDKTNGLVCGSEAEKLRLKMFIAIKEAGIIGE